MCIICIDLAKRAMSVAEARRALGEMRGALGNEHIAELEKKLEKAEEDERSKA